MRTIHCLRMTAIGAACFLTPCILWADHVQLTNGDTIQGEVVSLGEQQLVIQSENFGEMKIPRQKVRIIALGVDPIPQATSAGASGEPATAILPAAQNPQIQQQLNRLLQGALGPGGIGEMQRNLNQTRQGLEDLKKDLGPGSGAEALDGYIKIFELFGGAAPPQEPVPPLPPAPPRQPTPQSPQQ